MVTKELLAIQNPPPDFSIVVIEASSFYEGDVRSIHGLMNNGEGPEACSQEKLHHPGVEYVQVSQIIRDFQFMMLHNNY